MCDETGAWSAMVPACPAGTEKKPGKAGEVYFIQVEGIRRPAGLFLACNPFALPERYGRNSKTFGLLILQV